MLQTPYYRQFRVDILWKLQIDKTFQQVRKLSILTCNIETNKYQSKQVNIIFKMINSLYEINSALAQVSQQLCNENSSNQSIQRSISHLLSQAKYLQDKENYHYYLLVAEIYASRFNDIEQAQRWLQKFDKTLDSQISMNCQLRRAMFSYFTKNYKQAYKRLDTGLGQVEQQLKLIDNARFFFNRAFNKTYLINQSMSKNNFEAAFILSHLYQHQNQLIPALKQLQTFLTQSKDKFIKFQIYKRLLQLYDVMKKNSISTISVSKKSLQMYREEMNMLDQHSPQFVQDYAYKVKFINRVIQFVSHQQSNTSDKLTKKLLDYKLLAYYKLKRCSKQAPTKQIKMTLQNTAKLIKISKQTQLLESILNYDFIKNQYQLYKVFYDQKIYKKLAMKKFLNVLTHYTKPISGKGKSSSLIKQKETKFALEQQQSMQMTKNVSYSQYNQPISQLQPMSFNPNQHQQSILRNPQLISQKTGRMMNQSSLVPLQMKQTFSQDILNSQFQGSKMYKIHASSEGYQQRYFYINPQNISSKPRLYYSMSKGSKSSGDNYYSLKGLEKIARGKTTQALKRKQAAKFNEDQCFALIFDNGKDRSFYVPNEDDYQRWIVLLQTKVLYTEENLDKITHSVDINKSSRMGEMNKSSSMIKKSKKIVEI